MNFGGHIAVASIDRHEPLFWLGSALPDLAAMGRFRLLGSTTEPLVEAGIRFHHDTDSAFHGHPWFIATQRRLQEQLQSDGLGRGPARAIAHVGPELLLDGALDHESRTAEALAAIDGVADRLVGLVPGEHQPRWLEHLDRLHSTSATTDNDDPEAVAARLYRMLARRSRLAFDSTHLSMVAGRLATAQPAIEEKAEPLVVELAEQLGSPPASATAG